MANKQTLKNTTDRRVAQMRNELGGSNNLAQTSKFDKKNDKGIPVLNLTEYENLRNNINPIENIFRGSSISGLRSDKDSDYARLQELTPIYNQAEANRTQRQLERIGQTDIGRGTSNGLVNDIRNQGQGNGLERYINTPYSAPNVLKNLFQDNFTDRNGTLTPEMRALGITEESLQNWNDRQNEQERQEVLSQWAKDNPVISSINAVPENAFQSIANTARQVKDYVTGKPLETRETNADIYRGAVNEDIDSKVGQLAYSGANSLADMLFATLLTAPLGGVGGGANAARNVSRAAAAIMGAEKGNQVMNSAIERGLTPNQIMAEGAGSAFSTFATEALPLERILGGSHILSSMISEGLQEGAEDLVDTAIDELVTRIGGNADKSELHQNYNAYIEAGYDPDEAFKNMLVDYGKQVGVDVLLGGITGGLMGGGSNLMSGRNIITGEYPNIEVQTETQAEQAIPELERNARIDEQQNRIMEDYARAYAEEARQAEEAERNARIDAEQQRIMDAYIQGYGEEARRQNEYDPEMFDYMRDILGTTSEASMNWPVMSQEEKITNEVEAQKNRVLEAIADRNPLTGEIVDNFVEYVRETGRKYPNLIEYLRNPLSEIAEASRGWRTNYNGSIPELWNQDMNEGVARANFDIDEDTFLRDVLSGLNQPIPTVENVKKNEAPVTEQAIPTVENIQEEQPITNLTGREINQYRQQAKAIDSNLSSFGNKKKLQNKLKAAFRAIRTSEGEAQVRAVENFNAVVNEINETMAGETIGITARENNSDLYQDMKRVTDGYEIRITPEMVEELGLKNIGELNDDKDLGTNTGKNRIKFYYSKGTPIDSAYMEMYDLAHGALPSPENEAPSDLLKYLYKYIRDAKSGRNDMAFEQKREDLPLYTENPMNDVERLVNETRTKIENGTANGVDIYDLQGKLTDIVKRNPELVDEVNALFSEVSDAYYNRDLDEDIKNIQTNEQAAQALADEGGLAMNIEFFSEGSDEDIDYNEDRAVEGGKVKTSKFAKKTAPSSGIMTDEELNTIIPDSAKQYHEVTNDASMNKARELVKNNGFKHETDRVLDTDSKERWDAVDTNVAMMCWEKATRDARNAERLGVDKKEAWKKAIEIFRRIRQEMTTAGQAIQTLKQWNIRTPEGKLAQALNYANDVNGKQTAKDNELGKVKSAEQQTKVTFSDEFVQEFLEKAHSLDDANPTEAQKAQLDLELANMILSQVPKKFRHKFTTFWINNLLASARTLVTRNLGGNAGKFALDQTAVKAISGPVDKLVSKLTGERTTTGFTLGGIKAGWEGAKRSIANTTRGYWFANAEPDAKFKDLVKDFKTLKDNLTIAGDTKLPNRPGVEEDNFLELIRKNRSAYNNKGIEKVFKVYEKLINYGLAISDDPFYGFVYNQTMHELNQIRNDPNRYGGSFSKMSDEQFEKFAKAFATANGLEAVYQDNTKMSDGAKAIKEGIGNITEGMLGIDIVSNPTFPFVRTPMNVAKTNLEFSPLGIVKNVIGTIREVNKNLQSNRNAFDTTSFDQNRFVKETSRNIVGTLLWIGGLVMAHNGLLSGGYSDNKKEKEAQKQAGMQEYAFVNPVNGNQSSIDWIPAIGSDLISAAAFYDAFNKNPDVSVGEALGSGLKEGAESLFNMSALQGMQRLTGSTYNSDKNIVNNAVQSLANTASSAAVPAFVRQIAQAMDPYKRDTYSGDEKEDLRSSFINNIPFLRQTLQPRIGANGQPIEQNAGRTTTQKWLDNLLNPAMVTVPSALQDPVRDEAMRLFEETRSYDAFQPKMERSYLETEDHTPTAEEFERFSRRANSAMNRIARDVIDSDYYQALNDDYKQKMLKNIYDAVRQGERVDILGLDPDSLSGAAKAYYEDGDEGLVNYLTAGSALNQMGMSNSESYRDKVLNTLETGGTEAVQQMINDSQDLISLGFNENMVFKYNHATDYIPSLTPEEFSDVWTAIDSDGNSSIKQDEVIAFLNQNPNAYNNDSVMQYWNAFGASNWSKIPVLNPDTGLWEAKKV